jgi:hypothetical protein
MEMNYIMYNKFHAINNGPSKVNSPTMHLTKVVVGCSNRRNIREFKNMQRNKAILQN